MKFSTGQKGCGSLGPFRSPPLRANEWVLEVGRFVRHVKVTAVPFGLKAQPSHQIVATGSQDVLGLSHLEIWPQTGEPKVKAKKINNLNVGIVYIF